VLVSTVLAVVQAASPQVTQSVVLGKMSAFSLAVQRFTSQSVA
jgi:hypothetical protein